MQDTMDMDTTSHPSSPLPGGSYHSVHFPEGYSKTLVQLYALFWWSSFLLAAAWRRSLLACTIIIVLCCNCGGNHNASLHCCPAKSRSIRELQIPTTTAGPLQSGLSISVQLHNTMPGQIASYPRLTNLPCFCQMPAISIPTPTQHSCHNSV
ncbi:hypothetical protein E2C01_067256 [Portunus trituberculatus]|uniref:Uncharacterized protein n=1 Tax=Portunus trituberculatus TaxID=210409 RepID=A0A5B7HNM6_PORTR|nr:hypothetical protein [Portunus trituberculatus]